MFILTKIASNVMWLTSMNIKPNDLFQERCIMFCNVATQYTAQCQLKHMKK